MIHDQTIAEDSLIIHEKNTKQQQKLLEVIQIMANTDDKLFDLIKTLYNYIAVLSLILGFLLWKIFLWDYTNTFFGKSINFWAGLSEGYKILILSLLGSIPVGIIIGIVNHYIVKKIDTQKR